MQHTSGVAFLRKAKPFLVSLRAEKERLTAELSSAGENTDTIKLHPQAVERFRENIENLAAILSQGDVAPDVETIGSFRELVAEVILMPRQKGEEYTIQIKGYLSSLLGADLSAVAMVAKEEFEPPTQGVVEMRQVVPQDAGHPCCHPQQAL